MHIEPSNPIVKQFMQNYLTKDLGDLATEYAYDYDNVVYQVSADAENKRVLFSCKTNCPKELFKNGADDMLEELYKDFLCPKDQYSNGFDVTL